MNKHHFTMDSLQRRTNARNVSFRISLRWSIHIINWVDKTKLSLYDTHLVKIQWQKSCIWQRRWGNLSLTSDRSSPRRAQPKQNPWNTEIQQRFSKLKCNIIKERICIEQWWINWLWNWTILRLQGGFSLYNATKANTVGASSSFHSIRRVRLLPLNGIIVHHSCPTPLPRHARQFYQVVYRVTACSNHSLDYLTGWRLKCYENVFLKNT